LSHYARAIERQLAGQLSLASLLRHLLPLILILIFRLIDCSINIHYAISIIDVSCRPLIEYWLRQRHFIIADDRY
jgi:hypothetical protein